MSEVAQTDQRARAALQSRMLRAVCAAVRRVSRVAKGQRTFASDHEMRACLTLARLAPAALGLIDERSSNWPGFEITEEQMRLLDELERLKEVPKAEGALS